MTVAAATAPTKGKGRKVAEVLERLVDDGSFASWDAPIGPGTCHGTEDPEYTRRLQGAAARTGSDESVRTGRARIDGRPVAVLISEFGFLGGSIGVAAARRLLDAVHRATRERLPLVALPASGGTRMQEGTPAFVEMLALTRAVEQHKGAGLPYLVYLRHPTTGGVMASWAARGHVTFAEPGALLGFLGPQVFEALEGRPFPVGVQVAENLAAHGLVDAVVPLADLRAVLRRTLGLLASRPTPDPRPSTVAPSRTAPVSTVELLPDDDPWECVRRTTAPGRPGVRDLLEHAADEVVWLHGNSPTGRVAPDAHVVALVSLLGVPCVVVGQDRRAAAHGARLGPSTLRRARRALATARSLSLPVVTVVDTPGADLSPEAEESGLAAQIAACIAELSALDVPAVAVLLGQGTGGAALALLGARRVVAAQHAWLAPLPFEGASVILHGTSEHAAELARSQRIRARDLLESGFVDAVVPEPPDAAESARDFSLAVAAAAVEALRLSSTDPTALPSSDAERSGHVR